MSYIKLTGHYNEQVPGGVYTGFINLTLPLGNSATVELPLPFMPLGNNLGIAPMSMPDGASSVRFDFSRWSPVSYGRVTARFPFSFDGQEMAVKVARAFHADQATSWRDTPDQITAWLRTWGANHGLTVA